MKSGATASVLLFAVTIRPIFAQSPKDSKRKFDEAERRIVYLAPAAFKELPANVSRELQRRRCKVPQEAFTTKQNNIVRGEFVKPGQTDWAALCSNRGVSSILIFWDGSEKNPSVVAVAEDRSFLQGVTPDQIAYSGRISPVGRDFIMRHYNAYGGTTPPPIDHQGIDDAFIEKASVVHYFHRGKWLKLAGAD